ncbi:zinc metalloprotease [Acinetobacter bereziniae]|uniref:hypothetical protein n=1 Tax=Acinetobacter bereziniae TaxID=106648 RepID=UPI0021D2CCB9|nr:hypothetical protein [Acinetobacter bereziniae]MCU4419304.1 hypothetical protein [Acinetobacter bereziniae]
MGVGGASPTAGTSCATCLRKFTVHFRRNESSYKGDFGFDWIRDEYRYDQNYDTYDDNGNKSVKKGPFYLNDFKNLAEAYHSPKNVLRPYGVVYYPAWLSLFAIAKKGLLSSSIINKDGVDLKIEVEQLYFDSKEPLNDDGTIIRLIHSKKKIVLSNTEIKLSDLISKRNVLHLKKDGNKVSKVVYTNNITINIKCLEPFSNYEHIDVYAEKNGVSENVGRLVLYPNYVIPKAEIVLIDVLWGNLKKFNKPKNLDFHLKFSSLNQALIRAEVVADLTFQLDNPKIIKNADVISFLKNCGVMNANEIKKSIIDLYDKYGDRKPVVNGKVLNLDDDGHHRTFIFFTGLNAGNILGIASSRDNSFQEKIQCFLNNEGNSAKKWGNSAIIYNTAIQYPVLDKKNGDIKYLHTVIHELCHTLGLAHTFSDSFGFNRLSFHRFPQGYVDNLMDYPHNKREYTNNYILNKKFLNLFKWQWDIVRKDRSVN